MDKISAFLSRLGMIALSDKINVSIFSLFALVIIFLSDFSAFTAVFLSAVIIHEFSHVLFLRFFGVKIHRLTFYPFGVDMECDMNSLDYGRELICILSGSLANILSAVLGYFIFAATTSEAVLFFVFCNLFLGLCNLLPVSVFDGGRALSLIIDWVFLPDTAYYLARFCDVLGLVFSLLICFAVLGDFGFNLSLVAAVIYGFIANIANNSRSKNTR